MRLLLSIIFCIGMCDRGWAADGPRQAVAQALVTDDSQEQVKLISGIAGTNDESIRALLIAWKEGGIFLFEPPEGTMIPITLNGDKDSDGKETALRVDTLTPLLDENGAPMRLAAEDLTAAETDSNLRVAMKTVLDLFSLGSPDVATRLQAISTMGLAQDAASLPALAAREKVEQNRRVRRALREAIAFIQLTSEDAEVQVRACHELAALGSMPSQDALRAVVAAEGDSGGDVATAARAALAAIEQHTKWVNVYGTIFRGLSLGSILLIVALGLAVTFGLMGVINMAHGELIAVGAYTTYIVQNVFGAGLALSPFGRTIVLPGMNTGGAAYDAYFLVALPLSFLSAALVGLALERGIIRFLYRRPLESLLATWGVSLVLQQLFRLTFGANNVQVYSPSWLSGNWTFFDVMLGWNRVFVIGFAVLILAGTWVLLSRTSLGLYIRAVMQNRQMAACMGVRTERVNMLTFAFGSGLAGLAGAFLSQIGNVGPSLGQGYIVDAFMTVVVGGIGSLVGTALSALAIGLVDQSLQQILLNPVLGKILVLAAIILFLQWKPAGLFVSRSRAFEA